MRDNTTRKTISLFIFCLLFIPTIIFAQSTGSIGGRVTDSKDGTPLLGAVVKIAGSQMGATTDDNGEFVILNVDVGAYTVEASYIGYNSQSISNVRVSVDKKTTLAFNLTATGITTEVVNIVDTRRSIDVNESGRIVESQQITNTGIRGVTNIAAKTAGVVQDERGGTINIRGGRGNENIVIVDGVEMTNPLDGSSRAFVPNNLLKEIAVLTGGFGAEYGNVLSGVINVSTKSGSSRYSGSFEAITDEFTGRYIDTKSTGYSLYNVNFGGPIIPTQKLASVFNFFGSFERSYQRITIGSWILDKVPTIVPNGDLKDNESGTYSWNGRLNFNLSELPGGKIPINLRFGGTYNTNKARVLYGSNVYGLRTLGDGSVIYQPNSGLNPIANTDDYQFFGRLTANISSNFFFELQGNYLRSVAEQYDPVHKDDLTSYGDPMQNPELLRYYLSISSDSASAIANARGKVLGLDPATAYLYRYYGSVIDAYQKTDISYVGGKLDATWAILTKKAGDHEIKFGGEYKYHTLKRITINPGATADISISDPMERWYGTNNARLKTYGYEIIDPISGVTIADGSDAKHPIMGGFYARDKITFADFNVNAGVRVDFFDVNTQVFKSITTDVTGTGPYSVANDNAFEQSKMKFYVSPRLGFSFPVTDKTIFVAQYGKMVQMPQLSLLYVNQATLRRFLSTSLQDVIENSSLQPTKVTSYEIGFKQQVGDYLNMGITAFYKESTDLIGAGRVQSTPDGLVPVGFVTYFNNDFAVSRGLDFYLSLRRINRLAVDIAYSLKYASGTGSDPTSKNSLANQSGEELPQYVYALDYDQRHTGTVNLDYRFGSEDVPKGFLGDVLKNLGANLLFSFNSGRPYTKTSLPTASTGTTGDIFLSAKNETYTDWNFRVDLRVDKMVPVWKTNIDFYVYVINLLNTEIVETVFPATGNPYANGYLLTPSGASLYQTNAAFRKLYDQRVEFFSNWGPPRQVRFGVNVSF